MAQTTKKAVAAPRNWLETFPLASLIHVIAVIAVSVVFINNDGTLPDDCATYFALVIGGNSVAMVGRGVAAYAKGKKVG